MTTVDAFFIFKHPAWREMLTFQRNGTQSAFQCWSPGRRRSTQWSSILLTTMPPHTHWFSTDSWVGQRTYIPFEIKIFENLKMDLIFPGIFCTGLLKNCSTSFSGGTVTLLLIVTLGLNLSLLPFNRENGDLVQWAISRT